ncbi:MAG: DUF294 nucleotidyltransferase-like domain-containing protein [Dongiaceae bacterium]
MSLDPRERIDAFPYRHRLAEVMGHPVVSAAAGMRLADAAARMLQAKVSSLLLLDAAGKPAGIFTEHDLLEAIAANGSAALEAPLSDHASRPVETLSSDVFVYRALARMDRLGIRHIVVVDPNDGTAVGVVSARGLLKQRAGLSLALGDAIAVAEDGRDLAAVQAALPALARELLAEGLDVRAVAALISAVLRDMSARAASLAASALADVGRPAPANWCYLVLGSGGRGESQLIPDQDNALVHDGGAGDDPWFAELGTRASDILDQAGIPYCKGKVMASNPAWRGSLADWHTRIDGWITRATEENLLSVDIFYDFEPVHGDRALAAKLRDHAAEAGRARPFLVMLARELGAGGTPLGFFGGLKTEQGRLDLKLHGLFPIVAGARVLALKLGEVQTSTLERLRAATTAGIIAEDDFAALDHAQALFLRLILDQQILDIEAGLAPTVRVDIRRLGGVVRRRLKEALRQTGIVQRLVQDALTSDRRSFGDR